MKLISIFDKLLKYFGKQFWWPAQTTDEIIIGAILTQNTNWTNVEKSLDNLKNAGLLSLDKINKSENLKELIRPSGFFIQKSNYLKEISAKLDKEKLRNMPLWDARKYLLGIKGVGKETADSILLYAFNMPIFVVDAYTKRIFSRLELIKTNYNYDKTQNYFMQNLPKDVYLYNEFHALIVMLGKNFCSKQNPKCKNCPLKSDCKYYQKNKKVKE